MAGLLTTVLEYKFSVSRFVLPHSSNAHGRRPYHLSEIFTPEYMVHSRVVYRRLSVSTFPVISGKLNYETDFFFKVIIFYVLKINTKSDCSLMRGLYAVFFGVVSFHTQLWL
jgi:hypothetical protein